MIDEGIKIFTDGGARGNPGPAAIGVVIYNNNKKIAAFGKRIGESTNNVAEYTAVIEAFIWIKHQMLTNRKIHFFLDSNLLVQQLNGVFKVKNSLLRQLLLRIRMLEQEVGGGIMYTHIPRYKNQEADLCVNHALDA